MNRSWIAIHIASVRRALTLLYVGSAHAVHPTEHSLHGFDEWLELSQDGLGGRYIHTPSLRVRVPEVVLLRSFNGFLRHEVRFTRQSILERDNHVCQYCGKHFPRTQLTLDHVIPQSRGGEDSWENLVVACLKCNVRKGSRTPGEANMPLLHRPGKPHWMPRLGARIPPEQLMVWRRFVDTSYWSLQQQEIV